MKTWIMTLSLIFLATPAWGFEAGMFAQDICSEPRDGFTLEKWNGSYVFHQTAIFRLPNRQVYQIPVKLVMDPDKHILRGQGSITIDYNRISCTFPITVELRWDKTQGAYFMQQVRPVLPQKDYNRDCPGAQSENVIVTEPMIPLAKINCPSPRAPKEFDWDKY